MHLPSLIRVTPATLAQAYAFQVAAIVVQPSDIGLVIEGDIIWLTLLAILTS